MPFQKGNQLAKNRKSTKNLLPIIRERCLKALNQRLTIDNALKDIDTVDLLKFAQSIMPKDVNVNVDSTINYVSHTPRPIIDVVCNDNINNNVDTDSTMISHSDTKQVIVSSMHNDIDNAIINDIDKSMINNQSSESVDK